MSDKLYSLSWLAEDAMEEAGDKVKVRRTFGRPFSYELDSVRSQGIKSVHALKNFVVGKAQRTAPPRFQDSEDNFRKVLRRHFLLSLAEI
jgi:hypothetical protein